MSLKIVHIINPFIAARGSDLELAQPITFESMRRAKEFANGQVEVCLLSAQFQKDHSAVPDYFEKTPDLTRSVLDLETFAKPLHLPILSDILDRAYAHEEGTYIIYTNVDIAVQPNFYLEVARFIAMGHDAFIINRRRIPNAFEGAHQLDEMYATAGLPHPGFDCFVFDRSMYPKFALADVCIGVPFIGITLAQNIFAFGAKPKVFEEEHLTFHLGMELFYRRAAKAYKQYNRKQFWSAMEQIWDTLDSKRWPNGEKWIAARYWNWGRNPSLPVRLALKLEARRYFKRKKSPET